MKNVLTIDMDKTRFEIIRKFGSVRKFCGQHKEFSYSTTMQMLLGNYYPKYTSQIPGTPFQERLRLLQELGVLVEREDLDQAA